MQKALTVVTEDYGMTFSVMFLASFIFAVTGCFTYFAVQVSEFFR